MLRKPPHILRPAALLMALAASGRMIAAESALLGDQFLDDERSTQTLPRTAKWLYAGGPGAADSLWVTPPAGSGEMRMIASGSFGTAMATAYFTAPGSPKSLLAGESITLQFTAKLDELKNANLNFRYAMFNSLANRPTADSEAGPFNAAIYANTHSGYVAGINTAAATASFNVYERNNQGNSTPFSVGTQMGADYQASINLKVKQVFPVKLKISRSSGAGTSVTVEATVNGVVTSRTDSASLLTSFDGCGFYISAEALGAEQAVTVDDLSVVHSTSGGTLSTLLDDSFTDNDRTNQALPGSAQWFYAGPATAAERLTASARASAKNLVFTPGGSDAMTLAYFTASGSPKSLAVGESITFQTSVHLDVLANAADGIRFGLFNSGGNRANTDVATGIDSTATYNNYLGYSVWLNPGTAGGFNLYQRGGTGTNPFSASANTRMGADNTADLALTTSVEMIPRFSMTITRLASGMRIEAAINGRSVVRTEPTAVTTSFDTIAFYSSGAALYDGPQAVLDTVTVIHSTAIPAVPSQGRIFSQTFEGSAWTAPVFEGTQATGSVSSGAFGTIDVLGSVTPGNAMKLDVNSTGLTGYWSGALNSGLIPVTNSEIAPGKLTLSFDLRVSSVRPVKVRLESADAAGAVSGTLERTIHPAVPGSFQRFTFELSEMTAAGGSFSPAAPNIKLVFLIEGGVDAGSWLPGNHSLQVDNIYYARPAYYVKPTGNNGLNGRTEANAFATIAQALSVADDGDIILIMEGASSPAFTLTSGLYFSRGGVPGGWVTLKNYPGQSPLIRRTEPTGGSYDSISISKGVSGNVDYTSNLGYIEIRGLRICGTADTLPVADRGGSTAKSNLNGLSSSGRFMIMAPHHIRFADNEVFNVSAGGISGIDIDWWFVENNDVHDTSNWTIYGTSGISQLTPASFDGTAGTYRTFWLGNRSYRNETKIAWAEIGQISDGNGAILDTFLDTRHGPYLGRSIVANNVFYENGGSGVHALKVNGAVIINNTAVRNSHSPALNYPNIFAQSSNDFTVANNIIVASANKPINNATYYSAFPFTSGVTYLNNVYQSDGSTNTPYVGPNDSGNLLTTDVKFVNEATGTNDYRLRTGSPAFNNAVASSALLPIRDFYGILRRTDGLPDIGACERQPAIITAPASQTVAAGGGMTFSVAARSAGSGSGLTYQWQRDGIDISGATNSSLAITGASLAHEGDYRVLVSVPFDTVASPVASLTLQLPYPTTTTLATGENPSVQNTYITLTATVASPAGIPAGNMTFLDGATPLGTGTLNSSGTATLTINNLSVGDHSITATFAGNSQTSTSTSPALLQTVVTPYQAWLAATFTALDLSIPAISGPGADADADGLSTLLEYALAQDPLAASTAGRPVAARDGSGGLTLTFLRAREELRYRVQATDDLSEWETIAENPGFPSLTVPVSATDSTPPDAPERFLRLHVTLP